MSSLVNEAVLSILNIELKLNNFIYDISQMKVNF